MKKQRINRLKLNKKIVSNLEQEKIKGGQTNRCSGSWCWISLNEGPCPK